MGSRCRGHGGFGTGAARHVAFQRQAADLAGDRFGPGLVDVEHGDLGAGLGQVARHIGADARARTCDDRRLTLDLHGLPSCD